MENTNREEKIELSVSASQEVHSIATDYNSPQGTTKFCGCCPIPTKLAKVLDISLLVTAIVFVILVMLVPIAIHSYREIGIANTSTGTAQGNYTCTGYSDRDTCTQDITWVINTTAAANRLPSCQTYTGTHCRSILNEWQSCAIGEANQIFIRGSTTVMAHEELIGILFQALQQTNPSQACMQAATIFACQYYFPLCHCETKTELMPTRETCLYVSTRVCESEWAVARTFAPTLGITLPNCSTLLSNTSTNGGAGSGGGMEPLEGNATCSDMFYRTADSTCLPKCSNFESYSHNNALLVYYSQSWAAIFGITIGIIVIILSLFRWKIMLIFPSIFLVYMTIGFCVVSIFVIISIIGGSDLLCSSVDLFESIRNPSTYCIVTGAMFHYFLLNMTIWWFFHVVSVFYKVMFPAFAKSYQKKEKFAHIILLIIGILIPVPGVMLGLFVSDWDYTRTAFPQFLCTPRNSNLWYYSTMVPLNLLLMIGTCLLILMFWMVRKHRGGIFRYKKSSMFQISFAETKILFVLCYYLIFGVITLAYFGFSTANQADYLAGIRNYFTCEAVGHNDRNTTCDPSMYEQYNHPGLAATTFILMGLITTANLIFVINWKQTINKIKDFFRKMCYKKSVTLDVSTNAYYSAATKQ